jgi:LysM repeat protein
MPVASIYSFEPGDTLSKIARRYHVSVRALRFANQQITHSTLLQIGEGIVIPTKEPAARLVARFIAGIPDYDGNVPAPGTVSVNRAAYIDPPLTSIPGNRSRDTYDQLINQFAVGHNPRYARTDTATWCNIFVWDVTRAMNCELPHWLNSFGRTAAPFSIGANEITINGGVDWMLKEGVLHNGWQKVSATDAQDIANSGQMAVALWKNPAGHGHTAVVRPGTMTAKGPASAQAGSQNFNMGHIMDGFGNLPVSYFKHA